MIPSKGDPYNWVKAQLTDGQVVIDGGANLGEFSVMMAQAVGKEGLVYAVEPDPRCHHALQQITVDYSQVLMVKAALSSERDTRVLHQGTRSTESSLIREAVVEREGWTRVQAMRLDDVTTLTPSLVKLDLQGGEPDALDGATRLMSVCPKWVVEVWPKVNRQAGWTGDGVWAQLTKAGLVPHWWVNKGLVPAKSHEFLSWFETCPMFINMVLLR